MQNREIKINVFWA